MRSAESKWVFRTYIGAFRSSGKFRRGVECLGQFSCSRPGTESKAKVVEKERSFLFKITLLCLFVLVDPRQRWDAETDSPASSTEEKYFS